MRAVLVALLVVASCPAEARQPRSKAVLAEFQREHPCPSTGLKTGPCRGWQKDHLWPLCLGGQDQAWQLHWLSVADHATKTKRDDYACRLLKAAVHPRP